MEKKELSVCARACVRVRWGGGATLSTSLLRAAARFQLLLLPSRAPRKLTGYYKMDSVPVHNYAAVSLMKIEKKKEKSDNPRCALCILSKSKALVYLWIYINKSKAKVCLQLLP